MNFRTGVPADVVSEFAGGTIYQGLPDDFPNVLVPAELGLRVIGYTQRDQYQQQILLRSSVSRESIGARLRDALIAQGWIDVSRDFGVSGISSSFVRLCHDEHGDLSINANAAGEGSRLQVSRTRLPAQFSRGTCAEQQADIVENNATQDFYYELLPVLEVPEGTVDTRPDFFGGISSSFSANNAEISREGSIEVPDTSAAEIYEGFAAQMRAQGWTADSSDAGEMSATSVWTRNVTPPEATSAVQAVVMLSVVRGLEDFYVIDLKLRSPPAEGAGFGIIGVTPFYDGSHPRGYEIGARLRFRTRKNRCQAPISNSQKSVPGSDFQPGENRSLAPIFTLLESRARLSFPRRRESRHPPRYARFIR